MHIQIPNSNHLNRICFQFILLFFFQIYSVWKGDVPLFTTSMYMKKHSPLTPFIAHGIRKMAESGVTNLHTKRHIISKPNCKPLQSKGRPLGLEKLAFLFAFYIIGCVVSLITLVVENIYKSFSSRKKAQGIPSMQSHKKEELIRKIRDFRDDVITFLEENALHQKDNILWTTKQIEQIQQLNLKLLNLKEMA